MLTKSWKRPAGFQYPLDKRKRRFQESWKVEYPWLRYSLSTNGMYCANCITFSQEVRSTTAQFVFEPLTNMKHARGKKGDGLKFNHETTKLAEHFNVDVETLEQEKDIWYEKYSSCTKLYTTEQCLQDITDGSFPTIRLMIASILVTPVGTCTPERTFSAMRRIITWSRAGMSEERFNGLAMLHFNKRLCSNITNMDILKRWASKENRRSDFAL